MRKSSIFVKILIPFIITSVIGVFVSITIANKIIQKNIMNIYKDLSDHKSALTYVGDTIYGKFEEEYKALLSLVPYADETNNETVIREISEITKKSYWCI